MQSAPAVAQGHRPRWPADAAPARWRSAGRPSPVRALSEDARRPAHRPGRSVVHLAAGCWPASRASILLKTSSCGTSAGADLAAARPAPRPICSGWCGLAASTTCSSRSASDRLLQRGLEGVDQAVRQVADEADRVGQRHLAAPRLAQVELARGGVQRGEQLVGRVGARLDQRVEQRRLAGVGVADQRDVEGVAPLALAALGAALPLDLAQPLAGALDAPRRSSGGRARSAFRPGRRARRCRRVWRSRWDQRRTSRVLRYCRRASSTCSLPSWLRARCAKISRISKVRSLTGSAEVALEVALLRRAERLVEDDLAGADAARPVALISSALPLPTKSAASGALRLQLTRATGSSPAVWASRPSSSSSASKCGKPEVDADEDRAAPGGRGIGFRQAESTRRKARAAGGRRGAPFRRAAFGALGGREVDRAARHDGGNGVLVDHLRHGIAQQHDVLVERLDLALQLDAVDQIDRHRHVLAAQGVQERVL